MLQFLRLVGGGGDGAAVRGVEVVGGNVGGEQIQTCCCV